MKYHGKHKKKHDEKDKNKNLCHGRCPICRGYKGSTKNEPGAKKQEQRDIQERIDTGKRLSIIPVDDIDLALGTISSEDSK